MSRARKYRLAPSRLVGSGCATLVLSVACLMSPEVRADSGATTSAPDTVEHEATAHAAPAEDPHVAGQDGAHGAHGAHGHVPHFSDINWFTGMLAEREGPPSFLFRPPGTPVPLGALLLNSLILFYLIGRFGGPALRKGLVARKARIAGEIEAAAKMRAEAEQQLEHYEQKLHHMSTELERIMKEMRSQAEAEHARILEEAKVRREAMEHEARQVIEHELAHARQQAVHALIERSIARATATVKGQLNEQDQGRLGDGLVESVRSHLGRTGVVS